jgi:predicted ATPase
LRNPLIGRADDLDGVVATVRSAPATTIVGPGGVGKTTLALAAGHIRQDDFTEGAVFVDLTPAGSPDDVARILADATGVQGDASRSIERLADHLSVRELLVLLDNCEHVLTTASDVVDRLLAAGGSARVLATSREPLTVTGEHVWPLAPLESDAPTLFVERARAAEPRVDWDATDPAIIELCRRLDGLPLAVELAAGQLRRWGLDELSRQLEGELTALSQGGRRTPSRHGTMASAIDWSYQLLDEGEQRLLRQLSVFPSSFDLESARAVARDLAGVSMPATLGELVDKSLVVREPSTDRYRMLETIRVFARERLHEDHEQDAAFERLRMHVVDTARQTTRLDRWCSARLAAARRTNGDQARQAFWASLEGGHLTDAVEIAIGASFLWRNALGCTEGGIWLDALLRHELTPEDQVWALILLADVSQGIGDHGRMAEATARAREIDTTSDRAASCILAHYAALSRFTDPARAQAHLTEARLLADDPRLVHLVDSFMLIPQIAAGDAAAVFEQAEKLERSVSDDGYESYILHWVGWLAGLARQNAREARHWMDLQHAFLERTGIVETWITTLSEALTDAVDGSDARLMITRAFALADREGYRAEGDCALALAYSEACRGELVSAAELIGAAMHSHFNATAHYALYRVVIEPVVREQLGSARYAEAIERGRRRTAADALAAAGVG